MTLRPISGLGHLCALFPALGKTTMKTAVLMSVVVANVAGAQVQEEWASRYHGPGGLDAAFALQLDAKGNVYVTGPSMGVGSGFDFATIKYDPSGVELWVARYNGPGNGDDRSRAIAVDTDGNVYVTGSSRGVDSGDDFATVKYDADGNELWVARYNGEANRDDRSFAIALDSDGNVHVTGWSTQADYVTDYATVKYDSNGSELWVARYHGPSENHATALAVDSDGNVYVTGDSVDLVSDSDFATVKYDADGNELWVARYNGPGNRYDGAVAIVVDLEQNVYVAGESLGIDTGFDYATVKYDADGNELWVARYNGPGNTDELPSAMAQDALGNILVTGGSGVRGVDRTWEYTTVKYDADGAELWVARYHGPRDTYNFATAVAVDSTTDVYVTGMNTASGYTTVKYLADGTEQWVASYAGDVATAITVDDAPNVYVTGSSGSAIATVKYSQQ